MNGDVVISPKLIDAAILAAFEESNVDHREGLSLSDLAWWVADSLQDRYGSRPSFRAINQRARELVGAGKIEMTRTTYPGTCIDILGYRKKQEVKV